MDSWNEKTNPMITIIVPVYQVYQYVGACVESLLNQTYTNLEIILVDDGSTDGSGELCDAYAGKDARIRVIHQENKGLSGARNTGLDQARGKYIAFVDSDDLVAADYVEELYRLIIKYDADIAACAYERSVTGEFKQSDRNNKKVRENCMASEQILRQWHGKYKKFETVAWNKLYHRSVLNRNQDEIRFPEGRKHEDVLTSHLMVQNADRVALTTRALYLYRVREGSITKGKVTRESIEQNLSAQRERMAFFKEKGYWRGYLNLWIGYVLHRGWFWWCG